MGLLGGPFAPVTSGAGFLVGSGLDFLNNAFLGGLANGGPVTESGVAMVGERGPELVALGRGSHVVPNHYLGGYQDGATNMQFSDAKAQGILARIDETLLLVAQNTGNAAKGINNINISSGA